MKAEIQSDVTEVRPVQAPMFRISKPEVVVSFPQEQRRTFEPTRSPAPFVPSPRMPTPYQPAFSNFGSPQPNRTFEGKSRSNTEGSIDIIEQSLEE